MFYELLRTWLLFGLIVYLLRWVQQVRNKEERTHIVEIWRKHGIKPFLKGVLMILLGPILIGFMFMIDQKKKNKIKKDK